MTPSRMLGVCCRLALIWSGMHPRDFPSLQHCCWYPTCWRPGLSPWNSASCYQLSPLVFPNGQEKRTKGAGLPSVFKYWASNTLTLLLLEVVIRRLLDQNDLVEE